MLRTREWARRYCDMLDGADEAPTVNELYEAIDKDEEELASRALNQANRIVDRVVQANHRWRRAYHHEQSKVRDLRDEVNWLNAELHGAELKEARAERTCRIEVIETSDENDEGADYFQCTVCDETFSRRISDPFFPADFNYCPNCGAKVVE